MSYIAYELAMHPDIQDKIYENVVDKLEEFVRKTIVLF